MATVRIEDRNGNIATSTSNNSSGAYTLTDTLKRTLISISSFASSGGDTIYLSGLTDPYVVTWKTETSDFTIPIDYVDGDCPVPTNTDKRTVVSSIKLQNGQAYTFLYGTDDPNNSNPYGLLSKITYPSGGWVKYGYGINTKSDAFETTITTSNGQSPCIFLYGTPAVTERTVSFDGSHVALQQTFAYSTSWNSTMWTTKTSTVTTDDMVSGQTYITKYVYSYVTVPDPPYMIGGGGSQVPVESTITYENGSGGVLQTVTKVWQDQYLLTQEKITPAGLSSSSTVDYSYGSGGQVTKKAEYDYGQSSPTRVTTLTYETFPDTPIYTEGPSIFDRPCQVVTSDGNNNRIAETDYLYDGGTTLCGTPGTSSTNSAPTPSGTHDETNYGPSSTKPRGNATTKTVLCLQSCANAVTTFAYDETGQELSMKDPCGNATCGDMTTGTSHITMYSYADNYDGCDGAAPPSGSTNAYLTKITNPFGFIQSFCYGYDDGQLRGSTDENGQPTIYKYVDSLRRLTGTDYPDGGVTTITYQDATPSVTVSGPITTRVSIMDGMGHVTDSKLTSDPAGTDQIVTTYDGIGMPYTVSNPYRSTGDPTYGITTYTYDALGRNLSVKHPDGTTTQTNYDGRATEVTDEGNGTKSIQRISQVDGLGRMVSVCEVSGATQMGSSGMPGACGQDINVTGFLTSYAYDPLNDLLSVSQGGLSSRTFAYDSLSRLTSATNPESGVSAYTYDANGNLATRTQPEPNQTDASETVTTSYTYDTLNRMTAKEYSDDTSNVDYNYDETSPWGFALTNQIGRLTSEYDFNTGSVFSYDPMGRVTQNHQCTPQNCGTADFPIAYTYDVGGDILTSTDGQVNLYTRTYNAAQQLASLTSSYSDANHPGTLFSNPVYNAPGQLTSVLLGNGITETRAYNSRLEMTSASAGSVYSLSLGYAPDGDVTSANDKINGNWTYTYDDFNRLATASGPSQPYTYAYDRFGNRWNQELSGSCTSGSAVCLTFDANNHINNGTETYDAAGNLMTDGFHNYYYDAEHHLVQVDGSEGWCQSNTGTAATACYIYDAEGRRVRRSVSDGVTDDYLYDLSGHFITQVSGQGTWVRGEIYAGGEHIATYENDLSTPTTFFTHADQLGTERVQTAVNGSSCETITNLPFGDGMNETGSCDPTALRFTGKMRDFESNLDNFGARYNSSNLGRFMSPDPDDDSGFDNQDDPQSWNAYSYVRNSPLTLTDDDGRDFNVCADNGKGGQNCFTTSNYSILQTIIKNSYGFSLQDTAFNNDGDVRGGNIIDESGDVVGTFQYFTGPGSDNGGVPESGLGDFFMSSVVGGAIGGVRSLAGFVGNLFRSSAEGATEGAIEGATAGTGAAEVSSVIQRAGSVVGNQSMQVSSRAAAEKAAQEWVGAGARDIVDRQTGQAIGRISADGTRIARFTSASKAQPYVNLVNKVTGGNLHVRF